MYGTNPPNPKDAQGEIFIRDGEVPATDPESQNKEGGKEESEES